MTVTVNGTAQQLASGAVVADAVRLVTTATAGVAVALNDEVVRRAAWAATALSDGDQVEVLTAVQGG